MSEKYNERVREIAEKMAERKMGKAWNNTGPVYRQHQIDGFLPYARIAVAEMADEVRDACYASGRNYRIPSIEGYLIERGLIDQPRCRACEINEKTYNGEIAAAASIPIHTCKLNNDQEGGQNG